MAKSYIQKRGEIMIILHTLHWVQFAGTEKVCVDLCNEMSKEHTVYLLSNKKILPYISKRVKFIEVDFEQNRYNPIFIYKILQILKSLNPDIIHIHNTKELEIMYHARCFLRHKIPLVGTRHNPIVKKKFRLADLGVAVSNETLNYTNAKQNITITNGIPYKTISIMDKNKEFTIVGVGRLAPVKGFHNLITALSKVKFDFKLHIIGEGEQEKELTELINSLNLQNKIKLVGFVNNVQDHINNSDLQIISSSEEGLSLALIEGIFYAKVLIATDISNHREILGDELVFKNNTIKFIEKLEDVYENYDTYINIFSKIKEKKDVYSIENMSHKYIKAYQDLLK